MRQWFRRRRGERKLSEGGSAIPSKKLRMCIGIVVRGVMDRVRCVTGALMASRIVDRFASLFGRPIAQVFVTLRCVFDGRIQIFAGLLGAALTAGRKAQHGRRGDGRRE
jgi:hypothetical protein